MDKLEKRSSLAKIEKIYTKYHYLTGNSYDIYTKYDTDLGYFVDIQGYNSEDLFLDLVYEANVDPKFASDNLKHFENVLLMDSLDLLVANIKNNMFANFLAHLTSNDKINQEYVKQIYNKIGNNKILGYNSHYSKVLAKKIVG